MVSIIMPVLNGEKHIGKALLSIRNLKFPQGQFEVLIIDNGSTDRTPKIIRDCGYDFKVLVNASVSVLRNFGCKFATGEFLAFIDSDVEVEPEWLTNGLSGFTSPSVVACGCMPGVPVNATWVQKTWDVHQRREQKGEKSFSTSWLSSMNLIVRRGGFVNVGGFNENLESSEDVDLCYRLKDVGELICNPSMRAVHWGEAETVSEFFKKEVWRGMGNIKGVFSHGLRMEELPSIMYPIYMVAVFLFMFVGIIYDWKNRTILATLVFAVLLFLPSICLVSKTVYTTGVYSKIPQLLLLYFIYGIARGFSAVKSLLQSFLFLKD